MFEITPVPIAKVLKRLQPLSSHEPELWHRVRSLPVSDHASGGRPFVQLGADEIPGSEVDELLGYADIPTSNGPIGLALTFEPVRLGDAKGADVIFPVDGLEAHLKSVAPDAFAAFEQAGSMDALVESNRDTLSAREYLVGGVAECIRHCRKTNEALLIKW